MPIKIIKSKSRETYISHGTDMAPGDKRLRIIVDEISCGAKNLSMGWIAIPPRGRTEDHTRQTEEVIYVLKGATTIVSKDGEYRLSEGDTIFIPAGIAHRHENREPSILEQIWIFAPSGPERGLRNLPEG
jgi:quercetin dioxygenase-like cupin family protein